MTSRSIDPVAPDGAALRVKFSQPEFEALLRCAADRDISVTRLVHDIASEYARFESAGTR